VIKIWSLKSPDSFVLFLKMVISCFQGSTSLTFEQFLEFQKTLSAGQAKVVLVHRFKKIECFSLRERKKDTLKLSNHTIDNWMTFSEGHLNN
jgi:hypothetical protein